MVSCRRLYSSRVLMWGFMSLCHNASSAFRNEMLLDFAWIISTASLLSNHIFTPLSLRCLSPGLSIGLDERKCSLNRTDTEMSGSAYHKIARNVAKWLSVVEEWQIQSSTQSIANSLNPIILEDEAVLISFDLSSLYTNIPVHEAIDVCKDFLFSGNHQKLPVS